MDNESIIREVALKVPELAIMAFMVWMFLRGAKDFGKIVLGDNSRRDLATKTMNDEHMAARHESTEAINRNSDALLKLSEAIARVEMANKNRVD